MLTQEELLDRERYRARLSYLDALLPDELHRDANVYAVARALCQRDDFTIERCLVEMVKILAKVNADIMSKLGELYAARIPGTPK